MTQNTMRIVRHQDFKKVVTEALGGTFNSQDVAVVSNRDKKLADKVSAMDLSAFFNKMISFNKENGLTQKDVLVVSPEDLFKDDVSLNSSVDKPSVTRMKMGSK